MNKKWLKYIILLLSIICLTIIISKIIIDNNISKYDNINEEDSYVLNDNLYFNNTDIELSLYADGTYFIHQLNNNLAGKYKITNNYIILEATKKYNYTCYEEIENSIVGLITFDDSNPISITLNNNELNITDNLDNNKFPNINCSNDNEEYSDTLKTNIKYKHDITINNGNINYEDEISEDDKKEINEFLKEFFDRYYNIIATLKYQDISDMFINDENMYIYKTALELLLENRKNNSNDLTLSNVKYELNIKNLNKNGNEISFKAYENCSYNFEFIKRYTTSIYNIENEFKITKINGKYKISYYNKVQDFYVMITDLYKQTSNYKSSLDKIKNNYLIKFESENNKLVQMKQNYLNGNYETMSCKHETDKTKAYEYATKWVGRRNIDKWYTYGSNCANFVSQVMYESGVPMDYYGNEQWKWYSGVKNEANTASGFVYSWTYVPSMSNYFKNNTGYGLCGKYDENIYLGDIGDVIGVGTTGPTRHVVTVIGQIKDENNKVIDLLVSSNTVDLIYFPLSAYAYPYKALMKVYGYND